MLHYNYPFSQPEVLLQDDNVSIHRHRVQVVKITINNCDIGIPLKKYCLEGHLKVFYRGSLYCPPNMTANYLHVKGAVKL